MQYISSITLGAVQNGYHLPLIIPNKRITCWHTSMYNTLRHFCFLVSCMLVFPLSFHLIYSCHRANCTFPWLLLSAQLITYCYLVTLYSLDSKPGGLLSKRGVSPEGLSIRNTLYTGGLLSRGAYFWKGAYYPDYTVLLHNFKYIEYSENKDSKQ